VCRDYFATIGKFLVEASQQPLTLEFTHPPPAGAIGKPARQHSLRSAYTELGMTAAHIEGRQESHHATCVRVSHFRPPILNATRILDGLAQKRPPFSCDQEAIEVLSDARSDVARANIDENSSLAYHEPELSKFLQTL
jgi:hypothetical protein